MNRRRNSSGLRWRYFKMFDFEIINGRAYSLQVSKHGTHLVDNFFISNCSCKIEICAMWYAPCDLNKFAYFHSSISQNNIVDFIDDFWRSSLNYRRPKWGTSHVDVPRLNSFTQLSANQSALVQMCYEHYSIRPWFLLALNFS